MKWHTLRYQIIQRAKTIVQEGGTNACRNNNRIVKDTCPRPQSGKFWQTLLLAEETLIGYFKDGFTFSVPKKVQGCVLITRAPNI